LNKNVAESLDLDFVISKNNIKLTLITIYNKLLLINKKTTKINQVNLKQLIGLMALSYDALSIGQLFDIFQVNNIDVKKEQIEDYLTQIEDYLIKLPNNKQVFFHHHFANFIKNKLLETQEIVLIYELIINWLETLKNTFLHYYLEHIDNYLIDSILVCLKINDELKTKEVFINLINLLTNIKFLNEKINLGMFNELLSTYKKIISLIPSSLEQEFKEKLLNWFKFLDSESFVIKENIDLDIFLQQAINQNIDKEISIQAINYLEAFNPTQIYFNWLNKPKNHIYKSLKENLINGSVGIQAIKLTSDNKCLVIAGADGQIRIWDFLSKEEIAVLPNGNGLVFSLSLDKDNKYIVLGDSNSLINIWDLNKKELLLSLNKHTGSVLSLLFTTDNKYLISTSVDHTIKIWEFNIEKLIENQSPLIALKEENFIITSVIVTSENQEIIAGSNEGEIIFWDLKTQEKIASLNAHNFAVTSLALTSNNKYLISASEDRQIKIWDLSTKNLVATLTGATSSISKVKITSDDEYIIAGSNDKTIHIWNLTTGLPITVLTGHSDLITDIELTLDNKYVISSSKDGGIKLWNLDYAKSSIIETRQRFNISALAISSDGDLGISAEITGLIKIWDINNQQEIGTINAHKSIINALALTSNNKYLISAGDDFQIKVWDLHSLECIALLNDHQDRISSLLVTLDDKYLISGSDDKTIKIWNLDKKELDTTLPDRAGIYALILKEDNKHFASANFRGKLRLWDLTTKRVIKEQKGWFDTKIAITKNNKYQVSRSDNNFLTLFDLTNELVIATFPTISLVTRNVISDNGVILSCDQLGNLYFLKVENLET
jgi:WD40 repeat protein